MPPSPRSESEVLCVEGAGVHFLHAWLGVGEGILDSVGVPMGDWGGGEPTRVSELSYIERPPDVNGGMLFVQAE